MNSCLMCQRQVRLPRDCCVACEWLIRGEKLLRDAYISRGGTFEGLTLVKRSVGFRHGTENGYRYHGCHCAACSAAIRAARDRENARVRARRAERRAA